MDQNQDLSLEELEELQKDLKKKYRENRIMT